MWIIVAERLARVPRWTVAWCVGFVMVAMVMLSVMITAAMRTSSVSIVSVTTWESAVMGVSSLVNVSMLRRIVAMIISHVRIM